MRGDRVALGGPHQRRARRAQRAVRPCERQREQQLAALDVRLERHAQVVALEVGFRARPDAAARREPRRQRRVPGQERRARGAVEQQVQLLVRHLARVARVREQLGHLGLGQHAQQARLRWREQVRVAAQLGVELPELLPAARRVLELRPREARLDGDAGAALVLDQPEHDAQVPRSALARARPGADALDHLAPLALDAALAQLAALEVGLQRLGYAARPLALDGVREPPAADVRVVLVRDAAEVERAQLRLREAVLAQQALRRLEPHPGAARLAQRRELRLLGGARAHERARHRRPFAREVALERRGQQARSLGGQRVRGARGGDQRQADRVSVLAYRPGRARAERVGGLEAQRPAHRVGARAAHARHDRALRRALVERALPDAAGHQVVLAPPLDVARERAQHGGDAREVVGSQVHGDVQRQFDHADDLEGAQWRGRANRAP